MGDKVLGIWHSYSGWRIDNILAIELPNMNGDYQSNEPHHSF
ncbi:hypothetical protein [Paenibacillus durus]|nr:hypothetical protein [Paenibacillus durus]